MDEAYANYDFDSTSGGILGGAAVRTATDIYILPRGTKHRKRSGCNPD
jgi:hypothetical protein